nr:reverse transcriptase [Tanacetum cinerariifolium]
MNMGQDRQMQMIRGNGGNQFKQYAGQNAGNLNSKHHPRVLRLIALPSMLQTDQLREKAKHSAEDMKEGHFVKDCRSKQGNIARSAVYQELDLDDNWDIISADFIDSSVYIISKEEGDTHQSIRVMSKESLLIRDFTNALKIIEQLKAEQEQKDEEIGELKSQLQKEKEKHMQDQEEFSPLINSQTARHWIETEFHYSGNAAASLKVRKITNQLYNVKVEFEIPSYPMFGTTATGINMLYKQESYSRRCIGAACQAFERMLKIVEDNDLVLSPTKIAVSTVDFLGAVIGEGTIKLQPHIIKKIMNFNVEDKERIKQLAAAALYSVEEALQSPFAFQKNMKITCEEVMKISNHFQETSQKISSHMKNQEHYTCITGSKPIKHQSEWIHLVHEEQSLKTLKFQQQKKQPKPCEVYRQSYNVRPKSTLENSLKTTTGLTKENTSDFKTKKPEESSWNWKPLHNEIAATSWGDELSKDEATQGKVTILNESEERSDWDDDERKLQWKNPFTAKRGKNHTILHISKEEDIDDDNLPYLKFQKFKQVAAQIISNHEEQAFPSTSEVESARSYQPPYDSIMGPSIYPPAQQNPQPFYRPDYQFSYPQGKGKTFSRGYAKLAFMEILFGESEMLMLQQWRTMYPEAYSALKAIADEPQNITSQVRQLILLEDPYRGSTDEQDMAYRDLDMITYFDDSCVYSISKREGNTNQSISVIVQDTPIEKAAFMPIKESDENDSEQEEEDDQFSHRAFMFHPGTLTKITKMKEELWKSKESLLIRDLTDALKIIEQLKAEQEQKDEEIREIKSQLCKTRKYFWFHQVAMDEESISWSAFRVPGGPYEWLVMPFDKKEHAKHSERMLKIYEDNGLVLSPTKIKIAVSTVDFLGVVIGEGIIKLQPHIIKKIVNFNEEELKTKKGLRSFLAGSESRPPMLNKENYVPWSSRLFRYAKSRPNGKLIHNSILNGSYVRKMILEPGDANREITVTETFHLQTNDELSDKELKQIEADDKAIQTILLGLPEDIYAAVDSCETAQEIWLRVQQMMKGSNIRIQEKKAKLFNEWERFTFNEGEPIESYYHHFLKLMNDLKRNKHVPEKIDSNLKFLNNLQPEWSRHVTIVHQTKDLHTVEYTQLYNFMKYNQKEVNELKAERIAKTQDHLALMANSNNPYVFPAPHQDQSSFNQNYLQLPMPKLEDITDPTTAMNMALTLMAKAFKLNYSTPTNNNQRISSNPRNRQIAQLDMNMGQDRLMQMVGGNGGNQFRIKLGMVILWQHVLREMQLEGEVGIQLQAEEYDLMAATTDLDEIKDVNANCILMANLQQASTLGTQTDSAPVYDTDGSAKVHENCDDNEIFNMFTQEEQYTELLEPIPESHQVPQTDNDVISEDTSVEQGGETVDQHPANFEETRALYESL